MNNNFYPVLLISIIVILLNALTSWPIYVSGLVGGVIGFFIYLIQAKYFKK